MSKYIGDFSKNDTITFMFTTFRPSTGAPFLLGGTPVVSVYKDNNVTQDTAGVTLTTNYDGVTGLNFVSVSTSTAFYVDGSSYECVITTGTVDSVSVVGSCVGRFTMRDQAYLYPTTAGRTLDASATGQVIVATNNDKTGYSLSGTQTFNVTGNITGNVTGSVGSVTGAVGSISTGGITAASIATDAFTAAEFATSAIDKIADGLLNRSLATALASGNIAITSIVSSVFQAANTLALNDQVIFIGTAPVSFSLGAIYYVTSTSLSSTTFTLASTLGGVAVSTSSTGAFTARKIQDRNVLSALQYLRNKVAISGSTMTVSAEDDTTPVWTATLTTSPGVDPVTTLDPA
jgi:hypothetical protein